MLHKDNQAVTKFKKWLPFSLHTHLHTQNRI
jgi:hypothetical protein